MPVPRSPALDPFEALRSIDAAVKEFGIADLTPDEQLLVDELVHRMFNAARATMCTGLPGMIFSARDLAKIVVAGVRAHSESDEMELEAFG